MQGVNFGRNTFLDREELIAFQKLLREGSFLNVIGAASRTYGIVAETIPSERYFVASQGVTRGTIDITSGLMIDSQFNLINASALKNYTIPANGKWYWIKYGYKSKNYEDCVVSVSASGRVSLSSGTVDFTEKLRGISTKIPSSVKFIPTDPLIPLKNGGVYEVANVETTHIDLSAYYDFVEEGNLRMVILGSIPLTEEFEEEQLQGLFSYDSYEVTSVVETAPNIPPSKGVDEYYICRASNDGNGVTIEDRRSEWWAFTEINEDVSGDLKGKFPELFLKEGVIVEKPTNKTIEASVLAQKNAQVVSVFGEKTNLQEILTYLVTCAKNGMRQGNIEGYLTEARAGIYEGFPNDGFVDNVTPHWIVKLNNTYSNYIYITYEGKIYTKFGEGAIKLIYGDAERDVSGKIIGPKLGGGIEEIADSHWVAQRVGDTIYVEVIMSLTTQFNIQYNVATLRGFVFKDLLKSFPPKLRVKPILPGITRSLPDLIGTTCSCVSPVKIGNEDGLPNPCSVYVYSDKTTAATEVDQISADITTYWVGRIPEDSLTTVSGKIRFSFSYLAK